VPPVAGIEGLADLRKVLKAMDRDLYRELPKRLRKAAEPVAEEARRRAPRGRSPIPRGRRPRKRLVDTIRPFARGNVAGVRADVVAPGGYPYPRRIEYEGSGGNRSGTGPRAFMGPALEAKRDEVMREVARVLDDLADDWSRR
jgi:hypothetical protein